MEPEGPQKPRIPYTRQMAIVMELPFTLAGPIILGAIVGALLDHWLHTAPALLLAFGALGFFAGLRELARRMKIFDSPSGGGDDRPRE